MGRGSNDSGQIDVNSINTKIYREPTEVKLKVGNTDYSNDVVRIYTGLNHSAALLNNGNVITWGETTKSNLDERQNLLKEQQLQLLDL